MATIQKFLVFDVSSDANFDSIGKGIYDAIVTTMGWTEKADASRTDWTTNPARPAAGSYLWNVFGPSDALQTGATVYYLKVEVGLDATSKLSIRLSLGTATDGTGTLTGTILGPFLLPGTAVANQGATTFECNFSGSSGRLGIMLWRNGTANCQTAFFVERTLATDGTASSDGVNFVYCTNNAIQRVQTLVFGVGASNLLTRSPALLAPTSASYSDSFNAKVPWSPIFPSYGAFGNPMTVCGTIGSADVAEGGQISTTLYGASRIYLASGAGPSFSVFGPTSTASGSKLLMRYD